MKSFSGKNIIIIILILLAGFFAYESNNYKTLYEQKKDWTTSTNVCSNEQLRNINFLLNTYDNPFHQARAVVALKNDGCISKYPNLVKSAQAVVNKENEVVKVISNTNIASVDLLVKFEKNLLSNSLPKDGKNDKTFIELTAVVIQFNEEMKKRTFKEMDKYYKK
ncbi:hypothetical protein M1146_01840 [Patescibacteria group bacterium]|nr:hypothetical protein [Patescibacteria group bacterium]